MYETRHDLSFVRSSSGLVMAFAALLFFVGGSYAMGSAPADPKVITAADAGKTVSLVVGGQLTVQLDAQPGTGFGWQADAASTPLLSFKGSKFSGTNMPGGIETQSLSFVAQKAGEGELKLVYRQAWEKDTAPAKSFSVTVKIAAH